MGLTLVYTARTGASDSERKIGTLLDGTFAVLNDIMYLCLESV